MVLCGSISRHPGSLGAAMHQAGYAALGLDYLYIPFAVTDLDAAIGGMRALGIRGLGVSMPFKQAVMAHCDSLDPLARRIGAVNTLVNDAGRLTGFNTDAWGAARALEEATPIQGKRVLLLGAGGAARAVAFALKDLGATVAIWNRTQSRAESLAAELGAKALPDIRMDGFDILVNASAAGMADATDGASPVAEETLHAGLVVMDLVFRPVRTALIAAAELRGARTVHGGRMLLHQACRQFELYTGHPAPVAAMEAAQRAALG